MISNLINLGGSRCSPAHHRDRERQSKVERDSHKERQRETEREVERDSHKGRERETKRERGYKH